MMNSEVNLINRVANSGLTTINLEDYYPKEEMVSFDLKPFLFRELILKEMDFRKSMQEFDWSVFENKILCVYCSNDAIIPTWAYMIVAKHTNGIIKNLFFGNVDSALISYYEIYLRSQDWSNFKDAKIVIKGCSHKPVPASAYQTLSYLLLPFCSSIMYGEPCSTVPIFKAKKNFEKIINSNS